MITADKIKRFNKTLSNHSKEELNKVLIIGKQLEELLIDDTFQKFINNTSHHKITGNYDRLISDIASTRVLINHYLKHND